MLKTESQKLSSALGFSWNLGVSKAFKHFPYFNFLFFLLIVAVLLPLLFSLGHIEAATWDHLLHFVLPEALVNTFSLVFAVVLTTLILGVSLAWASASVCFWGCSVVKRLLVLPLAIPNYVLAFVFLGGFSHQGLAGAALGLPQGLFPFRSFWGLVLVMSLGLFPYVYLLAQQAFENSMDVYKEAAATLGMSTQKCFWRVQWPLAMPWIVSAALLVSMEVLADFGTVSIFNFDTLTVAIYKSWTGLFSWAAAAQLSLVLVFVVGVFLCFEKFLSKKKYYQGSSRQCEARNPRWMQWVVGFWCYFILFISLIFPIVQLGTWAVQHALPISWIDQIEHLQNTLSLGLMGASFLLVAGLLSTLSLRKSPRLWNSFMVKFAHLGYALPGTVLAVGILSCFYFFNFKSTSFIFFSVMGLVVAYGVRFFAIAYRAVFYMAASIDPKYSEAARILESRRWRRWLRVHGPLWSRGLFLAFLLSFVEIAKEMPMTLMLRPYGWDTLAIKVFELTSEGEWATAAWPSLGILFLCFIPVFMLGQNMTYNPLRK